MISLKDVRSIQPIELETQISPVLQSVLQFKSHLESEGRLNEFFE